MTTTLYILDQGQMAQPIQEFTPVSIPATQDTYWYNLWTFSAGLKWKERLSDFLFEVCVW